MERDSMEIIQELMEELQDKMQYSPEDLGSRLGRKKEEPDVAVMKIEASEDPQEMEGEMLEGMNDEMIDESPEDKLKKRLMKLRG